MRKVQVPNKLKGFDWDFHFWRSCSCVMKKKSSEWMMSESSACCCGCCFWWWNWWFLETYLGVLLNALITFNADSIWSWSWSSELEVESRVTNRLKTTALSTSSKDLVVLNVPLEEEKKEKNNHASGIIWLRSNQERERERWIKTLTNANESNSARLDKETEARECKSRSNLWSESDDFDPIHWQFESSHLNSHSWLCAQPVCSSFLKAWIG